MDNKSQIQAPADDVVHRNEPVSLLAWIIAMARSIYSTHALNILSHVLAEE